MNVTARVLQNQPKTIRGLQDRMDAIRRQMFTEQKAHGHLTACYGALAVEHFNTRKELRELRAK